MYANQHISELLTNQFNVYSKMSERGGGIHDPEIPGRGVGNEYPSRDQEMVQGGKEDGHF